MARSLEYLYILKTIPNFIDLMGYFRGGGKLCGLPLILRYENTFEYPHEIDEYRRGWRQTKENLISACAWTQPHEHYVEIVLRHPRTVCRYMPHRKCPYNDFEAAIRLINHEVMHTVLMFAAGAKEFATWDDPTLVKDMARHFPETFCYCEGAI